MGDQYVPDFCKIWIPSDFFFYFFIFYFFLFFIFFKSDLSITSMRGGTNI